MERGKSCERVTERLVEIAGRGDIERKPKVRCFIIQ